MRNEGLDDVGQRRDDDGDVEDDHQVRGKDDAEHHVFLRLVAGRTRVSGALVRWLSWCVLLFMEGVLRLSGGVSERSGGCLIYYTEVSSVL